jgi:hypothetical protein
MEAKIEARSWPRSPNGSQLEAYSSQLFLLVAEYQGRKTGKKARKTLPKPDNSLNN